MVITANGETIPLYTKTPLPFVPLRFFLLYSLCLHCLWHLLPLACPASRLSQMPEISSTTPLPSVPTKYRRNRAWLVPQFGNLPCYFLLPAFTRTSAIHAIVDMLSVASKPRFSCYSPVRTGSTGRGPRWQGALRRQGGLRQQGR